MLEHTQVGGAKAVQRVESLIAQALAAATSAGDDGQLQPSEYVRTHLAEHVGAGDVWEALEGAADLLDALHPDRVAAEAFRGARPVTDLPAGVAATLVTASALADVELDRQGRDFVRALSAARLRHPRAVLTPPLIWANLRPVHPHLPLTGHAGAVSGCAFGTRPDGTLLLATTSNDRTVRLWDPSTGTPLGDPLTGHTSDVTGCAFGTLPDGTLLLATTSNDQTVRLWDPAADTPLGNPLSGHTSDVTGCAFGTLPDGTLLLATTSNDQTVRLWDPAAGTPLGTPLTGHTSWVTGCAFGTLRDGTLLLATTSYDETVRLWDPATSTPFGDPLTGHTSR